MHVPRIPYSVSASIWEEKDLRRGKILKKRSEISKKRSVRLYDVHRSDRREQGEGCGRKTERIGRRKDKEGVTLCNAGLLQEHIRISDGSVLHSWKYTIREYGGGV